MNRTRPKPMSAKRAAQLREEAKLKASMRGPCVAAQHVGRVVGHLTVPPCYGPLEKDEIRSRARGGSPTDPANVQLLCRLHNRDKEDHPAEYLALGLARHSW